MMTTAKFTKALGLFLLFGLLFAACKGGEQSADDSGKLRKRSAKYVLNKMDKYYLDADWLNAKARVKLSDAAGEIKGTAFIRMCKDSLIWASVRKLNIEAARLLITPDSVYVVNRLGKNYSIQSASHIRRMAGLSDTGDRIQDFRNLYNLILGNPVFLSQEESTVRTKRPNYILACTDGPLQTEHWVDGKNFTLHKMKFFQSEENREAACTFSDYRKVDEGYIFSYLRNMGMYSREMGRLDVTLEFTRIALNEPKNIKFEIPDGYQRID
jgi:hypothetical protein